MQTFKMLPAWRTCLLLAVLAIVLVILSDKVLDLFPVPIKIASNGQNASISLDGQTVSIEVTRPMRAIKFAPSAPYEREYQIDGSDNTNTFTFDPAYFAEFASSPYYRFQALLRDEGSYSTWRNLVVLDGSNALVTRQARPPDSTAISLPQAFQLSVDLYRIEAPRSIELTDEGNGGIRIEIDRNDRYVRIAQLAPESDNEELAKWYFPVDWKPPLAEIIYMAMRVGAVSIMLVPVLTIIARLLPVNVKWEPGRRAGATALIIALGFALAMSSYASAVLFDKAPHVLDAVSYYFQGKIFASGSLVAPAPPVKEAFPVPFTVVYDGKWFSQYPPGTSLALALGFLFNIPWLVEPALAIAAGLLVYWIGRRQFGENTGILAAVLMFASPFVHLQAGSFLSHVPAMFFATIFLYAMTRYVDTPRIRWAIAGGVGLGLAFLSREIVAILYAVPVGSYVVACTWRKHGTRSWRPLLIGFACLATFGLAYLRYNFALTGSPFQLPRIMFNPADRFGFGQGIGFQGQNTPAAGLVNTDELLTSLTISIFGWPFYFALAIPALPFLLRQARAWDIVYGAVAVLYVLAYFSYFYHGIALGPRYYFEAVPILALLTARGFAVLATTVASILSAMGRRNATNAAKVAVLGLCAALIATNLLYFEPRQIALYRNYSGLPGTGGPVLGDFVNRDVVGRVSSVPNSIIVTRDWWLYAVYFAAMNCPRLDCESVLAVMPGGTAAEELRDAFRGRNWYTIQDDGGVLNLKPAEPPAPHQSIGISD